MSKDLLLIMAQLNFWVGDITGNRDKMIAAALQARDEMHADAILFPELALTGYPPEDLLSRPDFHQQTQAALQMLLPYSQGIDIILGFPHLNEQGLYNAAAILRNGNISAIYHKQCLPNYGVFDEKRHFTTADPKPCVIQLKDLNFAVLICEDLWYPQPAQQALAAGADFIICINASPFDMHKAKQREIILQQRIQECQLPIIYVQGVSGQDELIFDGGSLVMDKHGKTLIHTGHFNECLMPIVIQNKQHIVSQPLPPEPSKEAIIYQALVLGVRDYVKKNHFSSVLLGLSGGIDSALTCCIAVDAVGAENVHAVLMPSRYTSKMSIEDAYVQAQLLGVKTSEISIELPFNAFLDCLATEFANKPANITEENLQARCRGVILMALSNKTGGLVLTTGNKSELAVGYSTLYGDMAGGLDVLKDVYKTWVYRLAHYRNSIDSAIPERVLLRAPSAELALNQTDQDSLPPYEILDQILEYYVEQDLSIQDIVAKGFDLDIVQNIVTRINQSEHKRRQSPLGIRVTPRSFGRDRRYPITSAFRST
jgi:NAD+ synthase (glutamine-hydrolysing)